MNTYFISAMRRFTIAVVLVFGLFAFASTSFAQPQGPTAPKNLDGAKMNLNEIANQVGIEANESNSLESFVARIIQAALGLVGMIFLVRTIWAGMLIFQANGNEDKVTQAKSIITQSLLAVVIVFSAAAFVEVILNVLVS